MIKLFNEENEVVEETVVAEEAVEETTEEVVEEAAEAEATEEATEETAEEATEEVVEEAKEEKPAKKVAIATTPSEFMPENFNPFARPVNPRFANQREQAFESRLIDVKRVIKATKGGRRFKFSALVVVGDGKGRVGYGIGKSIEVPEAIKKAERAARKNIHFVKVVGSQATISHDVIGKAGAARVLLKPAADGKGIIASDKVRAVVELAGIRNIYSKNMGTNNPLNVVRATVEGLTRTKTKEEILSLRKNK